jgi:HAD superfamily hydrolase (TIGR01509 family)
MNQPGSDGALRAVIFDMDGVLCDSEPYMIRAAQPLYVEHYGLTIGPEAFEPFYGRGDVEFICGPVEQRGATVDREALMAAFFASYFKLVEGDMQALPGVVELVQRVHGRGLPMAVATSSEGQKLEANLDVIGLDRAWFDALVCAQDVKRKKPAPDLFLVAADRLGIEPTHGVVVEDSISGVQAAKAAGCVCVAVMTNCGEADLRSAGADVVIADLTQWPDNLM